MIPENTSFILVTILYIFFGLALTSMAIEVFLMLIIILNKNKLLEYFKNNNLKNKMKGARHGTTSHPLYITSGFESSNNLGRRKIVAH